MKTENIKRLVKDLFVEMVANSSSYWSYEFSKYCNYFGIDQNRDNKREFANNYIELRDGQIDFFDWLEKKYPRYCELFEI